MHISRRALLRTVAFAVPGSVAACAGLTPTQVITVVQQNLADASGIISAVLAAYGKDIPATVQAWISSAKTIIGSLTPGSVLSPTSVSAVLTDLSDAVNAGLAAFPGKSYLSDAQLVLGALTAAWTAVAPVFSAADPTALAAARARLAALPKA